MKQSNESFQESLEVGHKAEALVTKMFTNAGYMVQDIGGSPINGKYPHVDLCITGFHTLWVEVKCRKLYNGYLDYDWLDERNIEQLAKLHMDTEIPPYIVLVAYEETLDNEPIYIITYIISVYRARTIGGFIMIKDMMLLDRWLVKAREHKDKWRAII